MDSPGSIVVDDVDPRIEFSANWRRGGVHQEFNSTASITSTAGATFKFIFNGTSVSVFGTVDRGFPNSSYTLDGATPSHYRAVFTGIVEYQQLFYQSPPLPNGQHTLVGRCEDEGGRIILDFFVISTPSIDPIPTQTSGTSNSDTQSQSNVGAIVGGVVGGLVLVVLVILFLWRVSRKRHPPTSGGQPLVHNPDTTGTGYSTVIRPPPPPHRPFDAGNDVIYITHPHPPHTNTLERPAPQVDYSPYAETSEVTSLTSMSATLASSSIPQPTAASIPPTKSSQTQLHPPPYSLQ